MAKSMQTFVNEMVGSRHGRGEKKAGGDLLLKAQMTPGLIATLAGLVYKNKNLSMIWALVRTREGSWASQLVATLGGEV